MMEVEKQEHFVSSNCKTSFRKIYFVLGVVTCAAILSYCVIQNEVEINHMMPLVELQTSDTDNTWLYSSNIADVVNRSRCELSVLNDPEDPRFFNMLLEDEALKFSACHDEKKAASPEHSKLVLVDAAKTSYQKGEIIHVRVDMYDGYRKKKTTGGDLLRATIHDIQGYHHAPGVVTDNLDGSYTVEIKAFWSGQSIIKAMLAYTREVISAKYRVQKQILSTRNIYAMFTSGKHSEEVLCHPSRYRLLKATNNSELCDMTSDNSGMPFYCVKPKNVHLICLDWTLTSSKLPEPELPVTSCEGFLFKRARKLIKHDVTVNISKHTLCRITPKVPCSKYDVTNTWTSREPTGYFSGEKWNFLQCYGPTHERLDECLRNKRLYLIGDSTLRQWYKYLVEEKNCTSITEHWTTEQWHKPAECVMNHTGLRAGWYPHSQPFSVGVNFVDARYSRVSIVRRINNIPKNEHAIVVFQLYLHHLAFHYSVTQNRLIFIRKAVESFLKRNTNSVVLIKGPHSFSGSRHYKDSNYELYTQMLYDIFKGLHDRVVLLNNGDSTNAVCNALIHPPEYIVSAMVDQMFNFACK